MRHFKIGIVGGGPGGLFSAYCLQRVLNCGAEITIYEASGRLGGKILTPRFHSQNVYYEAGAAEFYDYSEFDEDPLKELIEELGLPLQRMGGSAVFLNNQLISNLEDLSRCGGAAARVALQEFDRLARGWITPQEFYHADYPEGWLGQPERFRFEKLIEQISDPIARRYLQVLIHSDLAAEPEQTSPSYGLQNYLMNDAAYMQLYSIEGGNERLPAEIVGRLQARILTHQPVVNITREEHSGYLITTCRDGEFQTESFDFVIVALPHNQLHSLSYQGERLTAAVDQHYKQYHFPAHYLRMTLLFERPFWKPLLTDSFWMLDEFDGCCLYDESSRIPGCRNGILGWLIGGKAACQWGRKSDAELLQAAWNNLPSCLNKIKLPFLEGYVHRWEAAVNALPGGEIPVPIDQRHRPEPIEHPQLFFVGDYLYDSTLNGVMDSAEYVASWIAAICHGEPKPVSEHLQKLSSKSVRQAIDKKNKRLKANIS